MTEPRRIDPVYRTGYNGTGGTLSKGTIVNRRGAGGIDDEIVAATAATDPYMGILANDILNSEYGDVQVGGVGVALAGSSGVTVGDRIMWETVADCIPCTSGNAILGIALTTAGSGEYFEIELVAGGGGPEMP
ncbi:MAG: hypothetical protein U9Q07_04185 [Planctomycetota bacterium]|nr:hypothetical protein [Planctomycetota bacterium]